MKRPSPYAIGDRFMLIGTTGPVFTVDRVFLASGFIPCVHGVNTDKRVQTVARVADVRKEVQP